MLFRSPALALLLSLARTRAPVSPAPALALLFSRARTLAPTPPALLPAVALLRAQAAQICAEGGYFEWFTPSFDFSPPLRI